MVANSTSSITPARHRLLSSGSLRAKASLADSEYAVLGASDCEGLPPQKRKKQPSFSDASPPPEHISLEDRVEVSTLSAEVLSEVATSMEATILRPSVSLMQAYRVHHPLTPEIDELDTSLAKSNWSVYSAKLML
jgi:hypothetical protein